MMRQIRRASSTFPEFVLHKPSKKFTDVEFRREYPGQTVAEHEVFMAFYNDADAGSFRDWWAEKGASLFNEWLHP